MANNVLYWLRASLAGPPGAASGDEERAEVYRAALRQFEELLSAAEATGYAARPLPLFYALSQAGRAVVACRGGNLPASHGLTVRTRDLATADPLAWTVSPKGNGEFQAVADATGSPHLLEPAALGKLMASLPELSRPLLRDNAWRRALYVERLSDGPGTVLHGYLWLRVGLAIEPEEADSATAIRELLQSYPSVETAEYGFPQLGGVRDAIIRSQTAGGESVWLLVRSRDPDTPPEKALDAFAPQYRWVGRRWLRPSFSGHGAPPSPLMTWWALLFALSMLARYHPAEWARALDRQGSAVATELERAMDVAMDALPQLILDAVAPKPILLPPFPEVPPLTLA